MAKGSLTISVKGVEETIRNLDLTNKKIAKEVQEQVGKSALNVQYEAKRRCPVDTGALRRSITVEFIGKMSARVGPHMPYAPFVELGTRKMRAKPFLTPAFEQERPKFLAELKKIAEKGGNV